MKRLKLLLILASMPSEAFGWIVVAIARNIFPDGRGGFQPASRASIDAATTEARALMEHGEDV